MGFIISVVACILIMQFIRTAAGKNQPQPKDMQITERAIGFRTSGGESFEVSAPRERASAAIRRYAESFHYKVAILNKASGRAVLERDAASLNAYHGGYWLILQVTPLADGRIRVTGDIRSKTIQASFALRLYRQSAMKEIRAYIAEEV